MGFKKSFIRMSHAAVRQEVVHHGQESSFAALLPPPDWFEEDEVVLVVRAQAFAAVAAFGLCLFVDRD
jgi:hypothetical protein